MADVQAGEPNLPQQPAKVTMDPRARKAAIQASLGGLVLLVLFVVMSQTSSDAPQPETAAETAAEITTDEWPTELTEEEATAPEEPILVDGCFTWGSTRPVVSRVMGQPDSIVFGEWVYGRSGVTFGYGTVSNYHNEDRNLRLCP